MHEHTRISKSLNTIVSRLDDICSLTQSILENNGDLSAYLKTALGEQAAETWMTQKEAAGTLKVARQTMRNWRIQGKLKPTEVGGRMLYARSEVLRRGKELSLLK